MKSFTLRFLLGIFVLGFVATSGWAQTHSGAIKALKVSGTVTRIDSTGAAHPVAEGDAVSESDTILTSADSGLVLVFMNGSSVKLGANSKLLVEEFKMDPLAGNINVGTLKSEPSVSQTKLNLSYGEMVGDVKHLNKSSTYNIKTPVGAAGIRGTQFRIVMTPSADGKSFTFQLSTAQGLVVFTGTTGAAPVEVPNGTQVTATATVSSTGAVTASQVTPGSISPAAEAAINSAVNDAISQAQKAGVFTPTEQKSSSSGSTPGGEAAGGEAPAAPTKVEIPASTPPQPTAPTVVSPSS